ncbi:MAG: RNA 2',3'-cyclic phosphodiesterase [bacterium]|jgi:2'-5' RNA ligase|nr:RNA 2',3'-cyclic phosphodiesterase [Phycisphaerales bacterium]MCE2652382.1 RNA 2',3'-cyclic phosphodiesterase [Planctomycetaceae bacterium]
MGRSGILRLFVAVYPPPDLAGQIIGLLADPRVGTLPPHRVTTPEQLHLTLVFIGDTPGSRLRDVRESVQRACAGFGPFTLQPNRLLTLPRGSPAPPPRLLAAVTDEPSPLMEIQRRLAARLTRPVERGRATAFLPHLTLSRYSLAPGLPAPSVDLPVAAPPIPVDAVLLMESRLRPGGAVHEVVDSIPLAG